MMHMQEATENILLFQEQLHQLRELSLADIDTSTPQDSDQATDDEHFSETQAAPTVQQHWAPQYPTQAGLTPTIQLLDNGANNMEQISLVKRIIGRTKPVPQVAPYDNVHVTRRERLLKNAQNRAQTIPTPDETPPNGPDWYRWNPLVEYFLEPADLHLDMDTPRNLSSSAKRSFDVFRRVMKSPQQQMNQGHVISCNVTGAHVHPKRPTGGTVSTAAEMKMQVIQLTQRMMHAEADGRIDDARALQGLIPASNETLKTCSITVDKRTPKE
ncbi:hypothetical protein SARC_02103 [Sphaeroforma arctica JP610]|uniref:Uncharacterized protein n=1 Tax=Sphaeroforma arctica JP610 TaxID=667725 RepID=A0A0L0G9Z6_9EUKA|nr:hypothetical protein SARC_02103 [Sphaeroforma arctica JP610]KNC85729.1 hypothetical protein SARC_02103 [Sphaeroforma arctica JP610]|eukprot:XP_014159631.1 hypothetical protein SARC_02103 [Sphaeroforma arctica JP610]